MLTSWVAVLSLTVLALRPVKADVLGCLSATGAVVSTSASATWDVDRSVFNEKVNNQPAAVAFAHSESQVAGIIRCSLQNKVKAVPRGGGHGYEGYAVQNGAIVVDVSNLTAFTSDGTTATFGSGYRLGGLYLKMWEDENSLFPAGLCPWVGTGGHILGGGTGLASRSYGLACDQLLSVNYVTATGNIITASKDNNSDLLWASCGGGGGNLGIVTSFTAKINKIPVDSVTAIRLNWSGYSNAAQIFDMVQKFVPSADRRLSLQILIGYNGVSINALWLGSKADAQQQLNSAGVLAVPGMSREDFQEMSYINATLLFASGTMGIPDNNVNDLNMTSGLPQSSRSYFQAGSAYNQQVMKMEGIQTLVNAISSLGPSGTGWAEFKMLQGAVADIQPTDTAFYWRESIFEAQFYYYWTTDSNTDQENAGNWLKNTMVAMEPWVGQGNYINYPDPILAATPLSDWGHSYYGGNLAAYTAVKTKYDPTNFFSNPLTVPPNGEAVTPGVAVSSGLAPELAPTGQPAPTIISSAGR